MTATTDGSETSGGAGGERDGSTSGASAARATTGRRRGRPARGHHRDGTGTATHGAAPAPDTRQQILTAARDAFAELGYDRTTVRGIARGAVVDPALVHHYFGTKEQVFAAAVADAVAPAVAAVGALPTHGDPREIGAAFVGSFVGVWEDPRTRDPLVAMARSALTNDTAAAVVRGFVSDQLISRLAGRLEGPDAALRVQLAASQLVGAALLRYVLGVEPLASAPAEEVVRRLTPPVQSLLAGPTA
ncbi:TetR/AcrR family transcriptional regulator [Streptomyces sp. SM14]|nr:TetR family transcriptional regulator [Streptomyces sp. SM14]